MSLSYAISGLLVNPPSGTSCARGGARIQFLTSLAGEPAIRDGPHARQAAQGKTGVSRRRKASGLSFSALALQ